MAVDDNETCENDKGAAAWNPTSTEPCSKGPLVDFASKGAPLWFFFLIWLFAGIAVVTDVYFTPSLESISSALGLSEDVAGATFLAAASSAPELAVSVADTFTVGDGGEGFGIGTIVGSAVFNILVIVALSCIPCDSLSLDWYPLARDSFFYIVSLILLLASISTDTCTGTDCKPTMPDGKRAGRVHWYESLLYVIGYAAYITYMKYSGQLRPVAVRIKDKLLGAVEAMSPRAMKRRGSAKLPTPKTRKVWEKRHSLQEAARNKTGASHKTETQGEKNEDGEEMPPAPKPLAGEASGTPRQDVDVEEGAGGDKDDDEEVEKKAIKMTKQEFEKARECGDLKLEEEDDEDAAAVKVTGAVNAMKLKGFIEDMQITNINEKKVTSMHDIQIILDEVKAGDDIVVDTALEIEEPFWDFDFPDQPVKKVLWCLLIPILFLFKITIPNAGRRATKKFYWFTFWIAIFWIGLISMYMLKMASWLSRIVGVHPTVTAVIIIAAGTSVPDAMGSYSAAKMGLADMAVSNALGSNVFNIFAGLGLPWLISGIVKCGQGECKPVQVPSDNIIIPAIWLFAVLFFFIGTLIVFKMKLQPKVGKIFMSAMCLYWAWNILNELALGSLTI